MNNREVMQQALEVLERAGEKLHWQSIGQAQRDLRAALAEFDAEPTKEGQTQTDSKQEPVAWRVLRSDGQYELYFAKASAERAAKCYISRTQVEPLYTHPAPQRQPQKPVVNQQMTTEPAIDGYPLWSGMPQRQPHEPSREMLEALQIIATPQRPDGTWNRDREACRQLAAEVLGFHNKGEWK